LVGEHQLRIIYGLKVKSIMMEFPRIEHPSKEKKTFKNEPFLCFTLATIHSLSFIQKTSLLDPF
jgi:hypothetical protein